MTIQIDKKSFVSVLLVLAIGVALALAIIFWKKEAPAARQAQADQHGTPAGQASAPEQAHDEQAAPDLVAMTPEQTRRAGIQIARTAPARIDSTVTLPGEVRLNEDRSAHIVPRVAGVVESVSASLGQQVRQGQALAVIASGDLAALRSNALTANRRVALARITFEREKKLWQERISAQQDYLQAEQAYEEARITAQAAGAALTALGAEAAPGALNRYVLRAPLAGVVVEKHMALGESVKEDTQVLLISDLSRVWVELAVTASDIDTVRVGQSVTITSSAGSATASGKISHVGNLLGETSRSARARVVIDNPDQAWRPGLFVNVALVRGSKTAAVSVAADAVQNLDGRSVVFIPVAGGFKAQRVTVGARDAQRVEVLDGIALDARYVATGSFIVKAQQGKSDAGHGH